MNKEISMLKEILVNEFNIKIDEQANENTKLIELGIDSLGLFALLTCFKEKYNVHIPINTDEIDNIFDLDMKFLASKLEKFL